MILIYSDTITPRLAYVADLVFDEMNGISYSLTDDLIQFHGFKGKKIFYSDKKPAENTYWIKASGFLSQHGVEPFVPGCIELNAIPVLFPSDQSDAVGFDVFSAVFYMVSRYEEYLPFKKDKHKRFMSYSGIGAKYGFNEKPVVHYWVAMLLKTLKIKTGESGNKSFGYKRIITFDIDNAWAIVHKGFIRAIGSLLRSVVHLRFGDLVRKISVHLRIATDPFDTYALINRYSHKHHFKPVFFFLLGRKSHYDRNIDPKSRHLKKLIRKTGHEYHVGIHPSYRSNSHPNLLINEIDLLKKILKRKIRISRQHYLKLQFPFTYQNLIRLGIEEDYSMGFADRCGFRAGIAHPFYFYDLTTDAKTNLRIFPFQVMDATLKRYLKLNPLQAMEKINEMICRVKEVNGTFIAVWHNESLSEWKEWKQWRTVFVYLAEKSQ